MNLQKSLQVERRVLLTSEPGRGWRGIAILVLFVVLRPGAALDVRSWKLRIGISGFVARGAWTPARCCRLAFKIYESDSSSAACS